MQKPQRCDASKGALNDDFALSRIHISTTGPGTAQTPQDVYDQLGTTNSCMSLTFERIITSSHIHHRAGRGADAAGGVRPAGAGGVPREILQGTPH